ncbi:Uma2 family endonuclease [Nodosilinea sp. FACHB-131]|uniref:Uma2 family endonuclease n=1 Tax=Cyanophyceae TaxID=3028117 RepID=UPI0016875744|nr:Uma2 family endonuclease [Nodosilinea sp. FACHB-131]MBD1872403.1 Uma2 family endonuclease [Nodosilinea sp. FACHB-131]
MTTYHAGSAPTTGVTTAPLESGDRLTRPEFERRYKASTVKKAEFIEGVVYVASPLRFQQHAEPHSRLNTWIGTYAALTPGTRSGIEPTVRLDLDNEPQPDIVLLIDEVAGGQARLSPDGYLEGTPELVIEIAASSAAIDLGDKKQAYRRNGVPEYLVWQVYENRLDWFYLVDGDYQPLPIDADGIVRSATFPGLWLAETALLQGNMTQVLAVLQAGLQSPEHQQFKVDLQSLPL